MIVLLNTYQVKRTVKKEYMCITDYILKMVVKYKQHNISALASQLAYDMLLSFFPFLIFLLTLLGHSSLEPTEVLIALKTVMPNEAYMLVENTVRSVLQTRNSELLSFSLIFTLYTASRGFRAIMYGLNRAYETKEKRNYINIILMSIVFMIGLIGVIMFVLAFLVFGEAISNGLKNWLDLEWALFDYINLIRYPVALSSMIFVFAAMYRLIPARKLSWGEVVPGAVFTTVGWLVSSYVFSFYVNNFSNYSSVYGTIGVIIVLMLWLYITSIIILLGGELNAILRHEKELKCGFYSDKNKRVKKIKYY
ncbi:YihY/virulence factor BrkB family protein [Clostridium senegalense]|uniref:YihY/virulence factor BrkB family protein n=1 Tax=Clostridium senegalense TaxID=1465809 RepID=UPI001F344759|nr:YihY/virulence factor BrkB family protein [Clostridium senegalense]